MHKMKNIFLIGPMGAGKSTIGRFLANELKLQFYDTDQEMIERTGADLAWIFDIEGEIGFQKREEQIVDELTQKNGIVLATGGSVVLSPQNRAALMARGSVIYLKTSLDQQVERTRRDSKRPLLKTPISLRSRLEELGGQLEPYYQELADMVFITDGLSVRAVAQQILEELQMKMRG